jgi:prepilin peptidase CpaA
MQYSQIAIAIPVLLILAVATIVDWRVHKLPNVLTFGSAVFAFALQWSLNGGTGLLIAAAGWAGCLICFLPFYAKGGMAAGDVKLMAAVGAFVGPVVGLTASVFSLIAGGLIALSTVAALWGPAALSGNSEASRGALRDALSKRIPYAGAIAAGTSFVLLVPAVVPPVFNQFGV